MTSRSQITAEQADRLLRFLPRFEEPGVRFIEKWEGGERTEDGALTLPYPRYTTDVRRFFGLVDTDCWLDVGYARSNAGKMLGDDALIRGATLQDIRAMLTYMVRGERFCDGLWGAMLERGRVQAVLRRLRELRGQMA